MTGKGNHGSFHLKLSNNDGLHLGSEGSWRGPSIEVIVLLPWVRITCIPQSGVGWPGEAKTVSFLKTHLFAGSDSLVLRPSAPRAGGRVPCVSS